MPHRDLGWLVGELHALAGDLSGASADAGAPVPLVLAIDQGGHASRAIAFDARGTQVAESFAPISTFRSGADRVEHDAGEVLDSIRTALADVHQSLGDAANRVVAAGLATQRSSIVCWDTRTHQPLSAVLSWQDRRNAAFVERLKPQAQRVREQTGLPLSPHYGASKLRWCLDNVHAVREARERQRLAIGPLASFLLHALLDEHPGCADPANASRTQLWDIASREWSRELADLFGVPAGLLPRCVPSRYAFGRLPFGDRYLPLTVCTGDQSAAVFAEGIADTDTIHLNIGTGAFLQRVAPDALAAVPGLLRSVLWSDDRTVVTVQEGTVNGAGSALDWLNERIGIDAHRAALALQRPGRSGEEIPLFMNGVSGVGSPYWSVSLDSHFVGEASEAAQVIAVIESIAFLICANIAWMQAPTPARRVLAGGGLSASDYLCECIATLSGLAVERTTLRESTATGLAFLLAGQPQDWHPVAQVTRFAPRVDAALASRYSRWSLLMKAMTGVE